MRILLLEDEYDLGETLQEYLQELDHYCQWAQNIAEAQKHLQQDTFDLAILDIGLPDGNGLDLGQEIVKNKPETLLIFLSALNDPDIRVQGLELGAVDYMTKPFALKELMLRIDNLKARFLKSSGKKTHGPFTFYFSQYRIVTREGQEFNLNQKEGDILKILYEASPEVVSRNDIIDRVWGTHEMPSLRTIDNYIVNLRKIFKHDALGSIEIIGLRSIGYKLILKGRI